MTAQILSGKNILTLTLVLLAAGSSAFSAIAAVNYSKFYPALSQISVALEDFQWSASTLSFNASVLFTVGNPSGYNGVGLRTFQPTLEAKLPNNESIKTFFQTSDFRLLPRLDPGSEVVVNTVFNGGSNAPERISQAYSGGASIGFIVRVEIQFVTILDNVSNIIASYECATGSPGPCELTDTRLYIKIERGSGGGT